MQSEFIAQQSNCWQLSVKLVPSDKWVLIYMNHDSILVLLDKDHLVNMIGVLFRHILVLEIGEMVGIYRIEKQK